MLDEETKRKIINEFKENLEQTFDRHTVRVLNQVLIVINTIIHAPSKRGKQPPKEEQIRAAVEALRDTHRGKERETIKIVGRDLQILGEDGAVLATYELKEVPRGY